MKRVGTADLKAHLSEHLRDVRRGETITVLDRREPVARIIPFEDGDEEFAVDPARGSLHDFPLPGPVPGLPPGLDVVDVLRQERADRS